jgi:hypothetical protein
MPRATTHKQHGRKSPLPDRSRRPDVPPAQDFMQLSSDTITFLRYAKTVQQELLTAAPDPAARADIEKSLAKCGEAMSSLTIARQNVLSRYTPSGAPKP